MLEMTTSRNGQSRRALVACAVAAMQFAFADRASGASWDQEPRSVLGIELGAPLTSVPQCPPDLKFGDFAKLLERKEPCWRATLPVGLRLYGLPTLDFHFTARLTAFAGRVQTLNMTVQQYNFRKLRDVLTARYGEPTSESVTIVQNVFGAEFESRNLRWSGLKTTIFVYERSGKLDESTVMFVDNETAEAEIRTKSESTNQSASKL